jgi:hypothetical protein
VTLTKSSACRQFCAPKSATSQSRVQLASVTEKNTSVIRIWTTDPEGPHADFRWTKKSFFIVDYDGNGDMPFELIDRKLKIYFNDFSQEGNIQSVGKDSLIIT